MFSFDKELLKVLTTITSSKLSCVERPPENVIFYRFRFLTFPSPPADKGFFIRKTF